LDIEYIVLTILYSKSIESLTLYTSEDNISISGIEKFEEIYSTENHIAIFFSLITSENVQFASLNMQYNK
jgi:hypothetical protein